MRRRRRRVPDIPAHGSADRGGRVGELTSLIWSSVTWARRRDEPASGPTYKAPKTSAGKRRIPSAAKSLRNSAPGAIRTHDPRIRNPVLYPPELRGLTDFRALTGSSRSGLGWVATTCYLVAPASGERFSVLVALQPVRVDAVGNIGTSVPAELRHLRRGTARHSRVLAKVCRKECTPTVGNSAAVRAGRSPSWVIVLRCASA